MRRAATVSLVAALLAGCGENADDGHAHVDGAHDAHAWTYADVGAWGEECATGDRQSPIDLASATDERLPALELDYVPSAASVEDTGHSVQTTLDDAGTMTLDGTAYALRQFHVHTPSEHLVDGTPYAAELHLVHEDEDAGLAVLGVLVEEGAALPLVDEVLAHAPETGDEPVPTTEPVDPAELLPADRSTFRYDGSLTTPPCSEGVSWTVLDQPVTWSPAQIAEFADRHPDSHRPPQPVNGRTVLRDVG